MSLPAPRPIRSRAARHAQLRRAAERVGELAADSFTRFLEHAALEAAAQAHEFAEGARERAAALPREFVDELTAPLFDALTGKRRRRRRRRKKKAAP